MISVLLADDHALVRSGFSMILSVADDIQVVAEAANGRDAVQMAAIHDVDVVLMDVQMPVMDGIEATKNIVASGNPRVIIVTTFDREDYLFSALRAGASGFLLKNADPDDLVNAVRAVANGHALLSPEVTVAVIRQFTEKPEQRDESTEEKPAQQPNRELESLTDRELQILQYMARGFSNAEIAQELFLGAATVKTHVSNVLAKTDSRDRVQAVVFAYRSGLPLGD